jgi:hypothetical protein
MYLMQVPTKFHHPKLETIVPEEFLIIFLSVVLFLWRAAFCPFSVKQLATFQPFLLSK